MLQFTTGPVVETATASSSMMEVMTCCWIWIIPTWSTMEFWLHTCITCLKERIHLLLVIGMFALLSLLMFFSKHFFPVPLKSEAGKIICVPGQDFGSLYSRAFQVKSTPGRTPISRVIRQAAWSKIRGIIQVFWRILTIKLHHISTAVDNWTKTL